MRENISLHRIEYSGGLQVADAPKPALWRRRVEPAPERAKSSPFSLDPQLG
jgi:hypothetical protein